MKNITALIICSLFFATAMAAENAKTASRASPSSSLNSQPIQAPFISAPNLSENKTIGNQVTNLLQRVKEYLPSPKGRPLGVWAGIFMMCALALAIAFKSFVSLFITATLYWMGFLYFPDAVSWLKSPYFLGILFILAVVEILFDIVTGLAKSVLNLFADNSTKRIALATDLFILIPLIFFLGHYIMSETFFLIRWGICGILIHRILKLRAVFDMWEVLKLISETAFSWWLEPCLLFGFLLLCCFYAPVGAIIAGFGLWIIPLVAEEL